jgi:hypothetical protein
MDVSIIISNYDPKGHLLACVDSALAQDEGAGAFDVVFPLHGPITEEELLELNARSAMSVRLRLLKGDRRNRAAALNEAVRKSAAGSLVFLESHVRAPAGLAARYRGILDDPGVAAVQGAFEAASGGGWVSEAESLLRARSCARRRARGLPADEFHLHSAGFRREALLAAGGFDERFPGIAEVPLLARIGESGGRIVPVPTPVALHVNHDDIGEYVEALRRRGREVGLLWRLEPASAARIYPSAALERHGAQIRRAGAALRLVAEAQLSLASLALAAARTLRLRALTLPAASRLATCAVRAGVLRGYCG